MATYYVAKTGNDATADGTNPSTPFLTIRAAAVEINTNGSAGDIIEIADEGTYVEGTTISINKENITIIHTASNLARPKIDADGGPSGGKLFDSIADGFKLKSLELYNFGEADLLGGAGFPSYNGNLFHIEDCYIHNEYNGATFPNSFQIFQGAIYDNSNMSITNPSIIEKSIIMVGGTGGYGFPLLSVNTGYLHVQNCLFTASAEIESKREFIIGEVATSQITCSFTTFINKATRQQTLEGGGPHPILKSVAKVINCIVSASSPYNDVDDVGQDGISSDDHTYNISLVSGDEFRNFNDSAVGSPSTGDLITGDVNFVNLSGDAEIYQNFGVSAGSIAINAGVAYSVLSGTVDYADETRKTVGPTIGYLEYTECSTGWGDYSDQPVPNFDASLTIQANKNLLSNYKTNCNKDVAQVPFYYSIKGAPTLRNRSTVYKVEK